MKSITNNAAELNCNICNTNFEFTTQYFTKSKFRRDLCPACRAPVTHSKAELEILEFVKTLTTNVICGNRSIISPLELDIFCPIENIAIEYCGLYWHGELQGKDKNYHINKKIQCNLKNVKLITIFEDEWIHKKEIVKSRLEHLFKAHNNKIFARKCVISTIDNAIARKFCKMYHLQGTGSTNISIGLHYNNELISVMVFSKLSISKGRNSEINKWELNRFCNVPNISIVGGASRLLQYFIKIYNPIEILSYSDNRWSDGNVYGTIGFTFEKESPPTYWYVDKKYINRLHRFSLRKNKTDDQNLTEWENRQLQGWDRIWDCGHKLWKWSKK